MNTNLSKYLSLISLVSLLFLNSCGEDEKPIATGNNDPSNIYNLASNNSQLTMFIEAIDKVGLESTFSDLSNLTVFTPSNAVFSAYLADLGYSDIDDWLTVVDNNEVKKMILYHVLGEEFQSDDLVTGYLKTLATNSDNKNIDLFINSGSGVNINGQTIGVLEADIEASNGTIHIIDGVLQAPTISDLIQANPDFSDLIAAGNFSSGDFFGTLHQETSMFSLLLPNNGAFNQYYASQSNINNISEMMNELGTDSLGNILKYHILLGNQRSVQFSTQAYSTRLTGKKVNIINSGGNLSITDGQARQAFFLFKDISALNGSIHIISNVLLPN
tara:strand:- start:35433 stop:36422 length:990 start_codon:yes stop_codon:yes gene_type:complete